MAIDRNRVATGGIPVSKDYKTLADSSEAVIRIATINLMTRRLKPG